MKRITFLLANLILFANGYAQNLQISAVPSSFTPLEASVSTDGILVTDGGTTVNTAPYNLPIEPDPSIKAYPLQNGRVVVRENIANFLLVDSFGRVRNSISNSTQSEGGEAISEFASDPNGKTMIIYNPKVISGSTIGSRAKRIGFSNIPRDIFYSTDRALSVVEVSANGEFIAFATTKAGTDDQVELVDRFGNLLNTITFNQEIKGVTFSENGLFVAIYSGGRVAAYEVRSGESIRGTSFRSTVQFAAYSPEDNVIIALTGDGNESVTDIELHAINLELGKIVRQEFSKTLSKAQKPALVRNSIGRYKILGYTSDLSLRVSF